MITIIADAFWLPLMAASSLWRVLMLQDYNTRVVLLGTVLLGIAAGLLGVYLLLRRRVLIGDAISHATLPGVALAYLWTLSHGQEKSLLWLLMGAAISGSMGGVVVLALRHIAKIREDAALGIVLSVFFGAGVSLMSIVQQQPGGNSAGLEAFIYGKAASMTSEDVWLCGIVALIVLGALIAFSKELNVLCFDIELARSQGWPVLALDSLLIGLVVAVTIVGLQAVGLILIIALLVIPAASARFWTHDLRHMMWISAVIGAISCAAGTLLSAAVAKLPSGATIVLAACALFLLSFAFGRQRGVAWRLVRNYELRREQDMQHFLRAFYEILESKNNLPDLGSELKSSQPIFLSSVCQHRHWSAAKAQRIARRLHAQNVVILAGDGSLQLTPRGLLKALSFVRDHRLLEHYMMEQAAAHGAEADREADYLEHGLMPEHSAELAGSLPDSIANPPPSPHELGDKAAGGQ